MYDKFRWDKFRLGTLALLAQYDFVVFERQ